MKSKPKTSKTKSPKSPLDNVEEPYRSLYKAVDAYVAHYGGKLLVIGGVEVQEWPGDRKFNFTLGIKCTGRKPDVAISMSPFQTFLN